MLKFFNKSFFKFTLGFLGIILVSLLMMAAVSAYAAEVSKIVFTTEEQNVGTGEISGAITFQTQDAGGASFQTPETLDLDFTSTSPTGEFLSSSGNPATKTMNKNTSNRTFYYRDSSSGTFTIKVVATGRDSLKVWQAEQKITVSSSGSVTNNTNGGEVLSAKTETSSLSSTGSAASVYYGTPSSEIEVTAGGNRLTSPGSPITFQAFIKKSTSSNNSLNFSWSFGDGNVGEGALVTHLYKYPGEYVVVLNAKSGNNFAVSRLKVMVTDTDIIISDKGEYLEIINNGTSEINIFNWKIINDGKGFVFQPDTIVLPKSSIKISKSLLKMKGEIEGGTVLKNFLGDIVFEDIPKETDKTLATGFADLQSKTMGVLDAAIAKGLVRENVPKLATIVASEVNTTGSSSNNLTLEEKIETEDEEGASSDIIYESPKSEGLFAKLTNLIKRVVSR